MDGERIPQATVDDVLPFLGALDASGWQPGQRMCRSRGEAGSGGLMKVNDQIG